MRLCKDRDIFKWEPKLFVVAVAERYICSGSGAEIAGTEFIANNIDFLLSGVEAGGILRIWNELAQVDLCCEIVSVGEEGHLTISAVRPDDVSVLWSPGNYTNLDYAVVSYSPVIEEVSYYLLAKYGLLDNYEQVLDNRQLRLCCVFAVLAACYASMALSDSEGDDAVYWAKSNYYRKRFEEYRCNFEVSIDIDGDGVADERLSGNTIILERK